MKLTKTQIIIAAVAVLAVGGIGTGGAVHSHNVHVAEVKAEKIAAHKKLVNHEETELLTVQTIFTESAKSNPDTDKYNNVVKFKVNTTEVKKEQRKDITTDKNIFVTFWNQQIDRSNVSSSDKNFQNVSYLNDSIKSIKNQLSVINDQNKDYKIYTSAQIKAFTNKVNGYVRTMQDQVNKLNAAAKKAAADKAAAAKAQAEAQAQEAADNADDSSSDSTGSYSYSANSNANSSYGAGAGSSYNASAGTSQTPVQSSQAPAQSSQSSNSNSGNKTYTDSNGAQITTHDNGDGSWSTNSGGQTGTFKVN